MKIMVNGMECDDLVHRTEKNTSNKITIYELLGLIKDGKAPKKIKLAGHTFKFNSDQYSIKDTYHCIDNLDIYLSSYNLNREIEIIEEVEDKEYEDIEEIDLGERYLEYQTEVDELKVIINALIGNQKRILEQLKNE